MKNESASTKCFFFFFGVGNRKLNSVFYLLPSALLRAVGNASPWTLTSVLMYEFTPETAHTSVLSMAAIKSLLSLPILSRTS